MELDHLPHDPTPTYEQTEIQSVIDAMYKRIDHPIVEVTNKETQDARSN